MKYIKYLIVLLTALLFFNGEVLALGNKLYFKEDGNKLYYDESLVEKDVFMNHKEFVPGKTYIDNIIIKNGGMRDYTLYFKLLPKSQSVMENKILNNLNLKVYINKKLVYSGNIKGENYSEVNLNGAIKLLKIKAKEKVDFKSEITLDSNYGDIGNYDSIYSDWLFYAYNNKLIEIIPQKTKYNIWPFVITGILIVIIIIVYKIRKKKKNEETNFENQHII
ncbi:MAG: hypothetical protein IKG27_04385 [Bacilli bacterium]|nr:hypothetical protein [Bacilli bacterium]